MAIKKEWSVQYLEAFMIEIGFGLIVSFDISFKICISWEVEVIGGVTYSSFSLQSWPKFMLSSSEILIIICSLCRLVVNQKYRFSPRSHLDLIFSYEIWWTSRNLQFLITFRAFFCRSNCIKLLISDGHGLVTVAFSFLTHTPHAGRT